LRIEMVRVPFPEDIIRPAVDGMAVIVGTRIKGQLIQEARIEVRLGKERWFCCFQNRQCLVDYIVIGSPRSTDPTNEKGNGTYPFMVILLPRGPRFQEADGPMPDIVVELFHPTANDAIFSAPGAPLPQNRLEHAGQKERLEQIAVALVKEQVGVVTP